MLLNFVESTRQANVHTFLDLFKRSLPASKYAMLHLSVKALNFMSHTHVGVIHDK